MVKKKTIIEAWNDFTVDVDDKEGMWEAVFPVLAAFDGKKIRLEASDITEREKALEKSRKAFMREHHPGLKPFEELAHMMDEEKETLIPEKIRRPCCLITHGPLP